MRLRSSLQMALTAVLMAFAVEARAVTIVPADSLRVSPSVMSVTTAAADRAESDIQIRRIKSLLAESEISSDAFFTQVENMRKKLGQ